MRGQQCRIIQLCLLTLTLSLMERGLFSRFSGRLELITKKIVIPECLYRGYDFSDSCYQIPDQKRFGNDKFDKLAFCPLLDKEGLGVVAFSQFVALRHEPAWLNLPIYDAIDLIYCKDQNNDLK
jgi:hypothetical protein